MNKKIDVCLSPDLLFQHDLQNTIVVVADIFRATSCMVAGLSTGVAAIRPVMEVEECRAFQAQGYLAGGERHAQKIEGFDLDNSPYSYMADSLKGKKIAMTTTNGTLSINRAKPIASEVLAAAFLNLRATAEYLLKKPQHVLIVCAGWKGRPCQEDTLFAGALAHQLANKQYSHTEDSTKFAKILYQNAANDMLGFLQDASHLRRLKRVSTGEDIPFCLEMDRYNTVIKLIGEHLMAV